MIIKPERFKDKESGTCVVLGNGPSLSQYIKYDFAADIIGINKSAAPQYWPNGKYYTTVSYDRLGDVKAGHVNAEAIFSCLHKQHAVPEPNPYPMVWIDMEYDDDYAKLAGKQNIFTSDLTGKVHKSFGGLFAVQVAWFLGYDDIILVGFDGGTDNFSGTTRGDLIPGSYHNKCMTHVAEAMGTQNRVKIWNANPDSAITWFEYKAPPIRPRVHTFMNWEVQDG